MWVEVSRNQVPSFYICDLNIDSLLNTKYIEVTDLVPAQWFGINVFDEQHKSSNILQPEAANINILRSFLLLFDS
ncbi:Hypothetical predicted protein [Octopus vulgaris]|uniref:Uncharacterized protein n=1 Tax=Octopus vulgaris TaxID=6645 RepID=A0AA36BSK1_OCTVU|nr:Hypothetical predicted protein [Octopus vulgaris]